VEYSTETNTKGATALELAAWLRTTNESAGDSLQEAFEELSTLHRLQVPARLRKMLMPPNPIDNLFSLVRTVSGILHATRKHDAPAVAGDGVAVLRAAVQTRERPCRDGAGIATIEAEHAEQ
jgi:hypothetical protein